MSFRILLIYPPTSQTQPSAANAVGLDVDRPFMPYGVMTIAANLRDRGFEVEVLNLCTSDWQQALAAIESRPADLFGISCYTFHRHAAAALGTQIKKLFPNSHLTIGGPHVWALARQWLSHYPAFDSVVIGEGEATILELAQALHQGQSTQGIPGTAYRGESTPLIGPPRQFIDDLDALGKPWRHFDYGFVVTSRGCPGKCTFCCSPALWGRKIRFRSAANVLDELEELVIARGHRFLNIKDDTFTARKSRVLEICRGIGERGLVFRWCCDTRVDCIDAEVLAAMRGAGCVRVNLGIESGSP
jgi:anaerobic magnesium-protoporphyrin IX monomethyl ester cyclase